jgi:hypothetical protein
MFENWQQSAGTRRVQQVEHTRTLATTRDVTQSEICRNNMYGDARPCTPVPPRNLHGKEGVDGSSPSEGLFFHPRSRCKRRLSCCRNGHCGAPPSWGGDRSWMNAVELARIGLNTADPCCCANGALERSFLGTGLGDTLTEACRQGQQRGGQDRRGRTRQSAGPPPAIAALRALEVRLGDVAEDAGVDEIGMWPM